MNTLSILLSVAILIVIKELLNWGFKRHLLEEKFEYNIQLFQKQHEISQRDMEHERQEWEREKDTGQKEYEDSLSFYHKKIYGQEFVDAVIGIYEEHKGELVENARELALHFHKQPTQYTRSKVEEILLSVPTVTETYKIIGGKLIKVSCDFNISIHEILNFIMLRYNFSELVIVPLDILCSNGIQLRNATLESKYWMKQIATPEIILSIANQRVKENYKLVEKLDQAFFSRLSEEDMPRVFSELYIMYRKLETYKEIREKNDLEVDDYTQSVLDTIDNYYKIYKNHVKKAV